MPSRLPVRNFGDHPLPLWVQPFLLAVGHDRCDYRIPPGARWWIVSERDLEIEIEVGYQSLVILVHGGVGDIEVIDETGVVQEFAEPPLGSVPAPRSDSPQASAG